MVQLIVTGDKEAAALLERLRTRMQTRRRDFIRGAVNAVSTDVKRRIRSADNGGWEPASKWIRAKKNLNQALVGTERLIETKVLDNRGEVLGRIPGGLWSFTQHHKGFHNSLYGPKELRKNGRVWINLQNPAALGLPAEKKTFGWVPQNVGTTPARKIWLEEPEAIAKVKPIASAWLRKIVREAGGTIR